MDAQTAATKPFLTDVKTLRERARKNIGDGAVTSTYEGDVDKTIEILQTVLATEIVCVLRYTMHAVAATGINFALSCRRRKPLKSAISSPTSARS